MSNLDQLYEGKEDPWADDLETCTEGARKTERIYLYRPDQLSPDRDLWSADFETTNKEDYRRFGHVRVWAWSLVRLDGGRTFWGRSIESFFMMLIRLRCRRVFFYNLAFDGEFIIAHVLRKERDGWKMKALIDGINIWYLVTVKIEGHRIEFFDSYKKFPGMSLDDVAEMYGIERKTLQDDRKAELFARVRPDDYMPDYEEIGYVIRDSEIQAHAMLDEWENGRRGLTLSSDAFRDVKETLGGYRRWRRSMPAIDFVWDSWMRRGYRGGWVYAEPSFQMKDVGPVTVCDVNSLYPFIMASRALPAGSPYWSTREPDCDPYMVVGTFMWEKKKGKLPTLQIPDDP